MKHVTTAPRYNHTKTKPTKQNSKTYNVIISLWETIAYDIVKGPYRIGVSDLPCESFCFVPTASRRSPATGGFASPP